MVPIERAVLVTGTSTGSIGSALAASFAQQKFLVFATARNPSKIPTSLSSLPNVEALAVDVTSPTSIEAAVEAVKAKNGGLLDYLVNNAGVGYTVPLVDMEVETGKRVFDVGVLSVTKAFMPLLVKAKGTVINISSVGAVVHTPWIGIYSASKAALTIASETLRIELSPFGVKVLTVMVGSISTKFHENNPPFHLPVESLYRPIEHAIVDSDSGKHSPEGPEGMNVNVFAEHLVADVLGGKTGQIWRGKMASMTRWVSTWVPWGLLDGMVTKGRGVDELVHSVKEG